MKVEFDNNTECKAFFTNIYESISENGGRFKSEMGFNLYIKDMTSACSRLNFIKKSDLDIAREEFTENITLREDISSDKYIINYIEELEKALEAKN